MSEVEHPDTALESSVQKWVFLREFKRGIDCYERMIEKSAFDDRWAGVCYFHLHEDMRAVELFYRAIARGAEAARINLAHALGYIERGDEVIPELLKVDHQRLSLYDKVLYHRVKSLHEETNGDLRTALQDAEMAWQLAQRVSEFSALAPDILSQLAVLHGRIGQAQSALKYIETNLAMSSGVDALKARIHRAHIFITLGRFSDAIDELERLNGLTAPKHLISIVYVYLGEARWALGHTGSAKRAFENAIRIASDLGLGFEEFTARIGLALIYAIRGQIHLATDQMAHAERLVADRFDRLYFRFREILVGRLTRTLGAVNAVSELRIVSYELEKMGALQEQAWVRLHIAHELWRLEVSEYEHELEEIKRSALLLQNPAFLSRELVLLPAFRDVLLASNTAGDLERSLVVDVLSIGREEVRVNGVPIELPLKRSVEILCYFLAYGDVTLHELTRDLFAGKAPSSVRAYFRKFREQLKRRVPGVSIVYDRISKCYKLSGDSPIRWDFDSEQVSSGDVRTGPFLPHSQSKWACEFEEINKSAAN